MRRNVFTQLIQRSIEDARDDTALLSIYSLLLKNKIEIGEYFAEGLLDGLRSVNGKELLELLNRLAARLALVAVLSNLREANAPKRFRRVNRQISYAHSVLTREKAIVHREFTKTWFDQLAAYVIAVEAACDLAKSDAVSAPLLSVLSERLVVAASYQLSHLEELLEQILALRSRPQQHQFAIRLRRAVTEGIENRWLPGTLRPEDIQRGADRKLDAIASLPPERITTALAELDLRRVHLFDPHARIEFFDPLVDNTAFRYAAARIPVMLSRLAG